MDRRTERQRRPDDSRPRFVTGVEVVGLVASIVTIVGIFEKISSSLLDHGSEKSKSRRTVLHLLQSRVGKMGDAYALGKVPDAVLTRLKELEQIAINLLKMVSSGAFKTTKCWVLQGSFDKQIDSIRKGLDDIEGALKTYGPSSSSQANPLLSYPSTNPVMQVQATTPHVQNAFHIANLTLHMHPTNGQAPDYNNVSWIPHVAGHAQIAQALQYNNAPGTSYVAPHGPIAQAQECYYPPIGYPAPAPAPDPAPNIYYPPGPITYLPPPPNTFYPLGLNTFYPPGPITYLPPAPHSGRHLP